MTHPVYIEPMQGRRPWRGRLRLEYWFRLVDPTNGKILSHSEGYARKIDRDRTISNIVSGVILKPKD